MKEIKSGNCKNFKEYISNGADVNGRDRLGSTVFMWACYRCGLDVVRYLVSKGANPRLTGILWEDKSRWFYYGSDLEISSGEGKLDIVKFFVEEIGLSPNEKEIDLRR